MNESTRDWIKILGFEAAVIAVIVLGIGLLVVGASGADANDSMAGPTPVTIVLDDLRPELAANYTYAAAHRAAFEQIPCYCGCDKMLGHRNLADCYITAGGAWDAHASGCAVCAQETDTARAALDAGRAAPDVGADIIRQYGPPPQAFTS